ncbi:MAG: hypothetical protein K9H41_09975 [Bacteroidia bacterium]|nr:hypothetical protein [Bacteroidia bacterium]
MPILEDLQNKIDTLKKEKFEIEDTSIIPDAENSKLTFGNKGLIGEMVFLSRCKQQIAPNQNSTCFS